MGSPSFAWHEKRGEIKAIRTERQVTRIFIVLRIKGIWE
jgi:hypothetical protein